MSNKKWAKPTKKQIVKWKANRKLWVKALRSKKYLQGEGVLFEKDTNEYCCLGVLCDIIGMKPVKRNDTIYFGKDYQIAPYAAMQAVGLVDQHGTYRKNNDCDHCLTSDNDEGLSFDVIANIIEDEPKGLFRENKW